METESSEPVKSDCYLIVYDRITEHEVIGPITEAQMTTEITSRVGTRTLVFAFRGERYFVSKGPLKYLLTPDKRVIPLFINPDALEPDTTGNLADPDLPPERRIALDAPLYGDS